MRAINGVRTGTRDLWRFGLVHEGQLREWALEERSSPRVNRLDLRGLGQGKAKGAKE